LADVFVHNLAFSRTRATIVPVRIETAAARLHGSHFALKNVKRITKGSSMKGFHTGVDEKFLCPSFEELGKHDD
jgi:hypothetical protein